jgi:hypothetical protein
MSGSLRVLRYPTFDGPHLDEYRGDLQMHSERNGVTATRRSTRSALSDRVNGPTEVSGLRESSPAPFSLPIRKGPGADLLLLRRTSFLARAFCRSSQTVPLRVPGLADQLSSWFDLPSCRTFASNRNATSATLRHGWAGCWERDRMDWSNASLAASTMQLLSFLVDSR